jgi:hypothetical protein
MSLTDILGAASAEDVSPTLHVSRSGSDELLTAVDVERPPG